MRAEISALQAALADNLKPWYRQARVLLPILIAALALILSSGTTVLSERRISRDHDAARRVELRDLVGRLTAMPAETLSVMRKYRADPAALQQVSGEIQTRYIVLSREAADVLRSIPDEANAAEYYAVAEALANNGYTAQSEQLLQQGLARVNDPVAETALRRQYGALLYATGDVAGGRAQFSRALRIFTKYPERNRFTIALTHAYTELVWGQIELGGAACAAAAPHLENARRLAAPLIGSPLIRTIDGALRQYVDRCLRG